MRSALAKGRRPLASIGLLAGLLGATLVLAQEPRVELVADVVLLSNRGGGVDPSLASMKDQFSKEGFAFNTYQKLSSQKVALHGKSPVQLRMPESATGSLQLESFHDGVATVRVTIDRVVNTSYKVGREGTVYINFGAKEGGQLILALSPSGSR